MAKRVKKREFNRAADRTYDYLMEHRDQVLRYLAAAVATGLLQLLLEWLLFSLNIGTLLPFLVRGSLLFIAAKFWVYRERGTDFFYTARQAMLAIMLVLIAATVINFLTSLLMTAVAYPAPVRLVGQGLLEILYFMIYQLIIFKESKNG